MATKRPRIADMTDEEFIAHLRRLAMNWRYSAELIGNVVRSRWPAEYAYREDD